MTLTFEQAVEQLKNMPSSDTAGIVDLLIGVGKITPEQERQLLKLAPGSHRSEECVGMFRCPEDAEASMADANERLWAAVVA